MWLPQRTTTVNNMGVLLLTLSGPMQAWGDSSRFTVRQTRREPTKSGVIGLIAAAQGRDRGSELRDLCALEFGVRIDQPGVVMRDFQTERSMNGKKQMPLSQRYYLADAKFLVALGGSEEVLAQIEAAIMRPVWPLYLGRRCCPPDQPLVHSADGGPYADVRTALRSEPWIASDWYKRRLELRGDAFPGIEVCCDAREGDVFEICSDLPLSFGEVRRYGQRNVTRFFVANPDAPDIDDVEPSIPVPVPEGHDPMSFF